MGLDRGRLFLIEDGPSRIVRAGVEIELEEVLAQDLDTLVIGDVVNIRKRASTGGHSLKVVCRLLRCSDNGVLDLSGSDATKIYPPGRAERQKGHEGDLDGPAGNDGGPGERAGDLAVHCYEVSGVLKVVAKGGHGGRPQDGGDGLQGATGTTGPDHKPPWNIKPDQTKGGPGGTGGAAGLPGLRGQGGAGGTVLIEYVLNPAKVPTCDVSGGDPGDVASPGQPGAPGPGGGGGEIWYQYCHDHIGGDRHFFAASTKDALSGLLKGRRTLVDNLDSSGHLDELLQASSARYAHIYGEVCWDRFDGKRGPQGDPGQGGNPQVAEVAARQVAPAKVDGTVARKQIALDDLQPHYDSSALSLISLRLEEAYRAVGGVDLSSCSLEALEFYLALAGSRGGSREDDFLPRIYSMSRKLNLGLDFFGYKLNQAPLLSFESYQARVDQALAIGRIVEDSFNAYWDADKDSKAKVAALRSAQGAAQQRVAGVTAELERVLSEAATALREIDALNLTVPVLYNSLLTKKAELDAAIAARTPGCDLVGALIAVATIVAGIATGGAALIGAAAAGAKLYDDVSADKVPDPTDKDGKRTLAGLWDKRYVVRDDLKEVGDQTKTVGDNIAAVRDAIKDLRANGKPPELPQFRMAREAFDEVAKAYTDMPEAAAYRDVGYAYLNAVETRSQRIIDYNAFLVVSIDLRTQRRSAERFADAASTAVSGETDPAGSMIVTSLAAIYRDTLGAIGQMVHAERKVLAYTFAKPTTAPQSQLTLGHLSGYHSLVGADYVAAKEAFAPKIELNEDMLDIELRDFVSNDTWTMFQRTGSLAFVLRRDHPHYSPIFENLPLLRVTGVRLQFKDVALAKGQTQIPWYLTHMGFERLYPRNGKAIEFSHRATPIPGFSPIRGTASVLKPDFSEKGMYTGVSPFAGWFLQVSNSEQLKADLHRTESVKLSLHGFIMAVES